MKINFLGACQEVGKSSLLVQDGEVKVMLDAGSAVHGQVPSAQETATPTQAPSPDAVVITHAHLDHCGGLPELYKHRPLHALATFPTIPLVNLLIEDSEKIALLKKKPLAYGRQEIKKMNSHFTALPYESQYEFYDKTTIQLNDAGHILGSAMVLLKNKKTMLYTGDFNTIRTKLHAPAQVPDEKIDALVIESTYALREHPERKKLEKDFSNEVKDALGEHQTVLIPAFAIGRTQELLTILSTNGVESDIYIDGMGRQVLEIMAEYSGYISEYKNLANAVQEAKIVSRNQDRKKALKRPSVIITTAGMCLHPDTFVQQADGVCKKISEVESEVYTVNNCKVVPGTVSRRVANPAPNKLLEIRTQSSSLKCTYEHEFMVLEGLKTKWKHASELKKGDYITAASYIPFKGTEQELKIKVSVKNQPNVKKAYLPEKTNPKMAQFLGYFTGDGHVKQHKLVYITDKDISNLKFYSALAKEVFGVAGVIQLNERNRLAIYSTLVAKFLEAVENRRSPKRRIPEFIQKSTEETASAFLRGLFDAEGTVSNSTNKSVSMYSSSTDIAAVTQALLLRFGIRSENREVIKHAGEKTFTGKMIRINNPHDLLKFAKKIGFSSEDKKKKLNHLLTIVGGGYSHAEIYPLKRRELYEMVKTALGLKKIPQVFGRKYELSSSCKKNCTRPVLEGVIKELLDLRKHGANALAAEIKNLLDSDLAFSKILGVKKIESDVDKVFDLTIPGTSNYIANGLVVHNCDGGPALSYLKEMQARQNGVIMLTGFQVPGTNGASLLKGEKLRLGGLQQKITLPVKQFDFSAHSGRKELFEFVKLVNPEKVYCMHGDQQSCLTFADELTQQGFVAKAPALGETYEV